MEESILLSVDFMINGVGWLIQIGLGAVCFGLFPKICVDSGMSKIDRKAGRMMSNE